MAVHGKCMSKPATPAVLRTIVGASLLQGGHAPQRAQHGWLFCSVLQSLGWGRPSACGANASHPRKQMDLQLHDEH